VGKPQTFRSPTAVVVWVVWLLFAVGNWIDLAVQGRDHESAVAAALLLLVTGIFYVTAQRPRIIADDAGVTIRNPLRDYRIGWAGVARVDVIDLLRVHCDGGVPGDTKKPRVISAWAVHYSRRRQVVADARARRAARLRRAGLRVPAGDRGLSYGTAPPAPETSPEAEAEKIVRTLSERATAARAEAVWAGGAAPTAGAAATATTEDAEAAGTARTRAVTGRATAVADWPVPLTSTWSGRAIAALVIPALIVLIVWLL
jgi:Bacterial PH domain